MLALIIELLERGINPSKILVLTYMNSAARNFQNRIKKACPDLNDIPYISTIHGLAYKIIQEEDNFTKLGLSSDFRTCDDIERPKILREICSKHLPSGESEIEWFERNSIAISTAKNNKLEYKLIKEFLKDNSDQYLEEFLPVYREYVLTLKGKNLVDYDDLLIMATELLNNYPEIKKYYQNLYSYVIEDEAQDSSSVQQELISIIAGKSGNLIRCGDINQAITTTFSNSDVQGFKDFIKNSQKVEMQSSQRCAKDIYELANNLIDLSKQQNHTKNAFYDIKMKPVEGKNPTAKNSLNFNILETSDHEKQYVLKQIKQKFSENPEQTAGVLLRTNWQVYEWASFLEDNGIKILCRTDSLKQIKVFRLILKLLEVIEYPWKNKPVGELFEEFINAKISKGNIETAEFIKERLGTPFITYKFISNVLPELENEPVINFWWEINYWLENSHIPPEELVTKIGNHYFKNILDRSNANLLSVLIKKYIRSFDDESINSVQLPEIVSHFKELANKNKISGVKLFSEQDETADNSLNGFVQVMTMHKAKGDEFDLVFIPEMTENNYTTDLEKVNLRNDNALIEKISELSGIIKKTAQETLTAQIEETLRLIYVGITRAGKYLYMTAPRKKQTKYGKLYDVQPSCLIMQLSEHHAGAKTEVSG
jgi:DNA helicase-2/ATP-dependent DNA helicase PcrA